MGVPRNGNGLLPLLTGADGCRLLAAPGWLFGRMPRMSENQNPLLINHENPFRSLPLTLQAKIALCEEHLQGLGSVVVAFSAGVDSTFLLAMAVRVLGPKKVLAGIGISASLPQRERQSARDLAAQIGAKLVEIETHELDNAKYAANPSDRCFFCKSDLFTRLKELAASRGLARVICGANADDTGDFRPGLRAGSELGVMNPLMDSGLAKDEIRQASAALGLPTWDKPAMACLASRVPYGQPITEGKLARIERAEYVLRDLGFSQCRVRDHETIARIEVPAGEVDKIAQLRDRIVPALKSLGYNYVTLDLQGFRSGSMNETLSKKTTAK